MEVLLVAVPAGADGADAAVVCPLFLWGLGDFRASEPKYNRDGSSMRVLNILMEEIHLMELFIPLEPNKNHQDDLPGDDMSDSLLDYQDDPSWQSRVRFLLFIYLFF